MWWVTSVYMCEIMDKEKLMNDELVGCYGYRVQYLAQRTGETYSVTLLSLSVLYQICLTEFQIQTHIFKEI